MITCELASILSTSIELSISPRSHPQSSLALCTDQIVEGSRRQRRSHSIQLERGARCVCPSVRSRTHCGQLTVLSVREPSRLYECLTSPLRLPQASCQLT